MSCSLAIAQNLVKNPSFEIYRECPKALGTFNNNVTHWTSPTQGSSDYFNSCSKVMGAPENFNGVQYPRHGDAYAGIYFFAPGDYREYLQASLKRTLRKGQQYQLEFYVSLAEGSDFAIRDFGIGMSYQPLEINTKKPLSRGKLFQSKGNRHHLVEVNHPDFYEDKSVWLKISTVFIAKGFENYITFGNFRNNANTRKVRTKRKETKKGAYYYIDAVSLIRDPTSTSASMESISLDSLHVLENVHFNFDQFQLNDQARTALSTIEEQMKQHPELHLEIHGHTDNWGSPSYNQNLSEKRAKTIAAYFIAMDIAAERITWVGHASTRPRASNGTAKGRAKNRRVEFVLREKEP